MNKDRVKNIIVIGASAGGVMAVSRLVATLPQNLDASVFIVIHLSSKSVAEIILNNIRKNTKLNCEIPVNGMDIKNGTIYLAKADHHLVLDQSKILVQKGAFENHWRPSIDVLFRSAAAEYHSRVIGVILTGLLDDGTSGMWAIKRCGGICMIQNREEAEFPDMPANVMNNMQVDYEVSVDEMGYILSDLLSRNECEPGNVPEDVKLEADITRRMSSNVEDLEKLTTPTHLTCPDCGGTLGKIKNDVINRYRCHTGHSFTEKSLEIEQIKSLEESLWVAIRMLEERRNLLFSLSRSENSKAEHSEQINMHINRLKDMLFTISYRQTEIDD